MAKKKADDDWPTAEEITAAINKFKEAKRGTLTRKAALRDRSLREQMELRLKTEKATVKAIQRRHAMIECEDDHPPSTRGDMQTSTAASQRRAGKRE